VCEWLPGDAEASCEQRALRTEELNRTAGGLTGQCERRFILSEVAIAWHDECRTAQAAAVEKHGVHRLAIRAFG
jgi:hypothetical protein